MPTPAFVEIGSNGRLEKKIYVVPQIQNKSGLSENEFAHKRFAKPLPESNNGIKLRQKATLLSAKNNAHKRCCRFC